MTRSPNRSAALATSLAAGLAVFGLAGCVSTVFPEPVTVSTRPSALGEPVGEVEDIGVVSVEQCAVLVLVIPVLDPWDPTEVYDLLLTKAEARGGHAVVHYRARGSDLAGFWPFFVRGCVEHRATAVRFASLSAIRRVEPEAPDPESVEPEALKGRVEPTLSTAQRSSRR